MNEKPFYSARDDERAAQKIVEGSYFPWPVIVAIAAMFAATAWKVWKEW